MQKDFALTVTGKSGATGYMGRELFTKSWCDVLPQDSTLTMPAVKGGFPEVYVKAGLNGNISISKSEGMIAECSS